MQPLPDYELPRDGNHVPAAGGVYESSTPTPTAGEPYALQLDSAGNLLVNVNAGGGGGGGGLTVVDKAAFTAGTSPFTPMGGEYNSTAQTLTSGTQAMAALDVNRNVQINPATLLAGEDLTNNVLGTLMKPVVGSQYDSGTYQNFGSSTTANIKATAGNLYSLMFTNINAAIRYIQFFNTATTPAANATALYSFILGAGTATQPAVLELDTTFFAPANYLSTGIAFAFSTTAATYVAATASDHTLTVNYV